MTDGIVRYLQQNGWAVETRDRRNLYFPQLRFLIKVEAQDQGAAYTPEVAMVNRMGFFFGIQVPPLDVLCAMKFCAILSRQKGRDFYDTIFLLSKTDPNLAFLQARTGISSIEELKAAVASCLQNVDLQQKKRDFVHLLFNEANAERVLQFEAVMQGL